MEIHRLKSAKEKGAQWNPEETRLNFPGDLSQWSQSNNSTQFSHQRCITAHANNCQQRQGQGSSPRPQYPGVYPSSMEVLLTYKEGVFLRGEKGEGAGLGISHHTQAWSTWMTDFSQSVSSAAPPTTTTPKLIKHGPATKITKACVYHNSHCQQKKTSRHGPQHQVSKDRISKGLEVISQELVKGQS